MQDVIHKNPDLNSKKEDVSEENQQNSEAGQGSEHDRHNASDRVLHSRYYPFTHGLKYAFKCALCLDLLYLICLWPCGSL